MHESEQQPMGMTAHRKLRRRTPRRPLQCPDDLLDYAQLLLRHRSLSQSDRMEAALGVAWPCADDRPRTTFRPGPSPM